MLKKQINELFCPNTYYFEVVEPPQKTEDNDSNTKVESINGRFIPLQISQKQIVELLKKQDTNAITQLYGAYGGAVYGCVLRIVRCNDLAQQVMQDTFLKLWHHGSRYDESKGQLFTWLLNIARNTAIDVIRSSHFQNSKKNDHIDCVINSHGGECLNPDTIGLRDVVKKMDYKYKVLIELIYFNQYTHEEAAEAEGIPLGTVKTRIRKAILELKKEFELQ